MIVVALLGHIDVLAHCALVLDIDIESILVQLSQGILRAGLIPSEATMLDQMTEIRSTLSNNKEPGMAHSG